MANKQAALKALRQSQKKAERNKAVFAQIRDLRRHFRKAIESKDASQAAELSKKITVAFDKAAQKGIIKKNTAARKKSRMMKKLNALNAAKSSTPKAEKKEAK